jgi:hypothetical protein
MVNGESKGKNNWCQHKKQIYLIRYCPVPTAPLLVYLYLFLMHILSLLLLIFLFQSFISMLKTVRPIASLNAPIWHVLGVMWWHVSIIFARVHVSETKYCFGNSNRIGLIHQYSDLVTTSIMTSSHYFLALVWCTGLIFQTIWHNFIEKH